MIVSWWQVPKKNFLDRASQLYFFLLCSPLVGMTPWSVSLVGSILNSTARWLDNPPPNPACNERLACKQLFKSSFQVESYVENDLRLRHPEVRSAWACWEPLVHHGSDTVSFFSRASQIQTSASKIYRLRVLNTRTYWTQYTRIGRWHNISVVILSTLSSDITICVYYNPKADIVKNRIRSFGNSLGVRWPPL